MVSMELVRVVLHVLVDVPVVDKFDVHVLELRQMSDGVDVDEFTC